MAVRRQERRGTATEWTVANPVLASGEIGVELADDPTLPSQMKVGDGVTTWVDLPYQTPDVSAEVTSTITSLVLDSHDVGLDGIVYGGQSNAVSQGTGIDVMLDVASDRVKQWPGSGPYVGQVIAGIDPLYHHEQRANTVGSGPAFARQYLRTIKINRSVCMLGAGHSATGFTTSSLASPPAGYTTQAGGGWDPTGAQGGINLYALMLAQIEAFLAADSKNRLTALVWHQGEADTTAMTQSQYAAKLDALIAGVRGLADVPDDLPVIVIQMIPERVASSGLVQAINAAHIATQSRLTRTGFAYGPPGMNMGDNLHYSAAGQRKIGTDLLLPAYQRALANVLGVAPLAPSSVRLAQAGTTVTVTIGRPEGRFTDFETQYRRNAGSWTPLAAAASVDITRTITGLTLGDALDTRVRTINEAGTSPWTTSSLTLATAANAPTGIVVTPTITGASVAFTPAGSGAPATSYRTDYRLAGAGSWTAGTSTAASPGTITGLTPATNYETHVVPVNAAGDGTPSSTTAFTSATPTAVLDDISAVSAVTAHRAYGLRKLRSSYAGSAIKVRRSSDNTTQNIGFTAGGDLDETALITFVGANSGLIDTWYDQSGNARDLTNTTAAQQARIVNAGTVDKLNGKPCAVFDGTDDRYNSVAGIGLYAGGGASSLVVGAIQAGAGGNTTLWAESDTGTAKYTLHSIGSGGNLLTQVFDDANTQTSVSVSSGDLRTGVLKQTSVIDSGTAINTWVDATAQTVSPTSYTRAGRTLTLTRFALGALYSSLFWKGNVSEVLTFASALSTGQRQAGQTNEKTYYGTV